MSGSKPSEPVRKPVSQKGFSLVETIAAMAILALAAVPLMELVTDLTRNTAWLENRLLARTVAENVLARAVTEAEPLEGGMTSGSETQMGREYVWTLTVSRPVVNQTQMLEVAVRAEEAGPVMSRLVSFRAVPGAAPVPVTDPARGAQNTGDEEEED